MMWEKKDVEIIKSIIDRHNGRVEMMVESKNCLDALESDNECVVTHSKYPGEKNKYIVEGTKLDNKYVFIESYIA